MKRFLPSFLRLALRSLLFVLLTLSPFLLVSPSAVNAQWEPERRLTYARGLSWTSSNNAWCIAANDDTVHVVWWDARDGNWEIYYKRSLDGGSTWAADTRLTYDSLYSWYPSVAVSGPRVHVVWDDMRNGNEEIYYKRSTDGGGTWGTDTRLSGDPNYSEYPSVAAAGSNVHVVWDDTRDNFEIYYKRSTTGGLNWGAETRLTYDSSYSMYASVAVSGSNVHVAWKDFRDGYDEIYYKRSSDNGTTWSADVRLTNDTSWSEYPSVAASGSLVHVVWEDYRNGNWDIYYLRSTDDGASWAPETLLTNNPSASEFPSLAASGSNVHVAWQDDRDDIYPEIYYKHSSDGGMTWSGDARLTYNPNQSFYPSIAATGLCVHVVWQDGSDDWEIYYARNRTGNAGVEKPLEQINDWVDGRLEVISNPFVSFTAIPHHEMERFALYDISGRRVGTYRGDRIGEDLSSGVYFLKPLGKDIKPLRIVKVK